MKMKTTTKKKKATATMDEFWRDRGQREKPSTNLPHSELSLHLAGVLCFGPNDNDTRTLG